MSTTEQRAEQLNNLHREPVAGIMDKAVCVKVELRRPGTVRKVGMQVNVSDEQQTLIEGTDEKTTSVPLINKQVKTDATMLRVSKYIMNAPEMEAIQRHDAQIRRFMMTKALPSIFQSGVYLVPNDSVGEVDLVLKNFAESRQTLVNDFMTALPRIKAESKERLNDLSGERDFLSDEKMSSAFSMKFDYISYGVNEKLKQISADLFDREVEKSRARFAEAEEQIKIGLRVAMSELVNHAVERLTGNNEDGKRKTFKKSMLTTMTEFLDNFGTRNIVNDDDLKLLVDQAKQLLDGVDPESLRKNEAVRDNIANGFNQVKAVLDTMMENQSVRMIRMDDEEVA